MPHSSILRDCTPAYWMPTLHTPLHPSIPQLALCVKIKVVLEAAWRAGTASTLHISLYEEREYDGQPSSESGKILRREFPILRVQRPSDPGVGSMVIIDIGRYEQCLHGNSRIENKATLQSTLNDYT